MFGPLEEFLYVNYTFGFLSSLVESAGEVVGCAVETLKLRGFYDYIAIEYTY